MLVFAVANSFGQGEIIYSQDFENDGSMPDGWKSEFKYGDKEWVIRSGGGKPAGSQVGAPPSAHSGKYNALFHMLSMENTYHTYLVSPIIDFSNAHKPQLSFWYSQFIDQFGEQVNNFEFTLCYRVLERADTSWIEVKNYSRATDAMEPWRCDSLFLPEDVCKKSKVQIGFLGKAKTIGHGCCIDDIVIKETQITNKYLGSVTAANATTNSIPTEASDIAVLRLRVPVFGNSGALMLNSFKVKSLMQTAQSVKTNGVKLYYTGDEYFTTTNLLATSSVDADGYVSFNNINYELNAGVEYLWVACDIKKDVNHDMRNNIVDFMVEANSLTVGGRTYPSTDLDPAGARVICESIFFDDFEDPIKSDTSWTLEPEFERGEALGLGAGQEHQGGNADPSYAHSGNFIMGTDLTGSGEFSGSYEMNLAADQYSAITRTFDCYYYKDISLQFYRWLNIAGMDIASIKVSNDDGETWNDLWSNNRVIVLDKEWTFQNLNLNKMADRNQKVKLKFSLGPTVSSLSYSGWNIDDVALIGTFVYYDAAITDILTPHTDCGFSSQEPISIKIKNVGYNDIETPFVVSYSIDGGAWVDETISDVLPKGAERTYTFETFADLIRLGEHDIKVKVELKDSEGKDIDEDKRNSNMERTFISLPYLELPYAEDFEVDNGYWTSYGDNKTWQHGKPSGNEISSAYSGSRCWVTNLKGEYPQNDSSWLESPCFNMTKIQKPIVDFMLRGNSASTDGLTFCYSIDNGETWKVVPFETSYERLNWYNTEDPIDALNAYGWTGDFGWTHFQQILPDEVAGQESVKFRFVFASQDSEGYDGFAIDNIKVYESPVDAGVVAIVNPVDACLLSREQPITISIQNFGNRSITSADSLIASVTINDKVTLTDTFRLSPTQTIAVGEFGNFTFTEKVNMWNKKTYNMVATTKVKGDTLLFNAKNDKRNNDSFEGSATVKGEPAYTLGPDIGTLDPTNYALDGGKQSNGKNFKSYEWHDNNGNVPSDADGGRSRVLKKMNPFADGEESYLYSIKVTNDNDCVSESQINIIKSTTDVGVVSVDNLHTDDKFCNSNVFDDITVTVKNYSSYAVKANDKITICYEMLDDDSVKFVHSEDTILSGDFNYNYTFSYKFKTQPNFQYDGVQEISFFTLTTTADINHSNDSLTLTNLTVWPLPKADLGIDSILTNNPDTIELETELIPGAIYSWQSGTAVLEANTFDIADMQTQLYTVGVTDEHNCATVYDQAIVVSNDWDLVELLSPTDQCLPKSDNDITVKLQNNGYNTFAAGYKIPATITIGGATFKDIITLDKDVAPDDYFEYTFSKKMDLPAIGKYSISVKINPEHELNRDNNFKFETISVWGVEKIDLGADTIFTLAADTVVLDAGPGFSSYVWNEDDNQTNQTYQVTETEGGNYFVVVTSEHGCYDESQIDESGMFAKAVVTVVAVDISIDEITAPINVCDITSCDLVEFTISNIGNDNIDAGEVLPFMIQVNDREPQKCPYILTSEFLVNAKNTISVPSKLNFTSNETYSLKVWLDWNKDKNYGNDTAMAKIDQLPNPSAFSLGDDIYSSQPDTIVLQAPVGMANYAWFNGANSQSLQLPYMGTSPIYVKIANEYGCSATDTVLLTTYDLELSIISGAVNSCVKDTNVEVWGRISVNSLDVIPEGTDFIASFSTNGYSKQIPITLGEGVEITGEKPYDFNFAENINLPDTGDFVVTSNLFVTNLHEVDTNNEKQTNYRIGAYQLPFRDTVKTYNDTYIIDAGDKFSIFNWNDDEGNESQTYVAVTSGLYKLDATDVNGCSVSASTFVMFVSPSYDIVGLGFKSSRCEGADLTPVSFYLKNTGNDIISTGSQISISYKVDGISNDEAYTMKKTLQPNDSVLITFTKSADFRTAGEHSLEISANVAGNTAYGVFTINTLANPIVSLGADITSLKQSATLAPTDTYGAYLWSTGASSASIDVTADGDYWVKVTNSYGCYGYDTVHVHFVPSTVAISEFKGPKSACGSLVDQMVSIDIVNNGQKTITSDKTIGVKCEIGDIVMTSSIQLPMDFTPNAVYNHSMDDYLNLSDTGVYNIKFYVDVDGVLQDSATYYIYVYSLPIFNFESDEIKVKDYPYNLSVDNMAGCSYLWNTGDVTNSITVSEDGTYNLTVTNSNNCTVSKSVNIMKVSNDTSTTKPSIDVDVLTEITIHPNPARSIVNVDFNGMFSADCQIMVANASGQIIYVSRQTSDVMQINVSDWKQGIYFIKIVEGNTFKVMKFVKE